MFPHAQRGHYRTYNCTGERSLTKKVLEKIIKDSMPTRRQTPWHKRLKQVSVMSKPWRLAYYITKAKIDGYQNGQSVEDYYAKKRLLFRSNVGLDKYGTIGPFWVRPKKVLWQEIAGVEKQISDALQKPGVRRLVNHIYDLLCETVSIREIERSIGSRAHEPSLQAWIEKISLSDEPYDYWADIDG